MTIDLPYYTGLILAFGVVIIPVVAILASAWVKLSSKDSDCSCTSESEW
jgi:hypothetical protein